MLTTDRWHDLCRAMRIIAIVNRMSYNYTPYVRLTDSAFASVSNLKGRIHLHLSGRTLTFHLVNPRRQVFLETNVDDFSPTDLFRLAVTA